MGLDRIPLIIGITGHRELHPEDVPRVKSQLQQFFERVQREFPHTPLLLLSSMCEGADRIAARVSIETPGVSLAAVLPWPEGIGDQEWHRGGDRTEFDELMVNATHKICLPLADEIRVVESGLGPEQRQRCFAEVSRYISRHCQVLVAIWNGSTGPECQTWQVIQWHINGTEAPFAAALTHLDAPETGPLLHLPVRSGLNARHPSEASSDSAPKPSPWNDQGFLQMVGCFDRFNADVLARVTGIEKGVVVSRSWVFSDDEQKTLPQHVQYLLSRFALADQMAIYWQQRSHLVLLIILGVIFVAVACFESYAHKAPDNVALLVAYPLILAAGLWFVRWTRKKRFYNRYLDDRALAEAMRVHLFWKLAGVRESASDYYLRTYRSQLDWIRAALRSWSLQSGEHDCECTGPHSCLPAMSALSLVRSNWMENQRKFFEKASKRDHKQAHDCHRWAQYLVYFSMGCVVMQSLRLLYASYQDEKLGQDPLTHWLIIIIAMSGGLAGLFHEYSEKRLFEKQSRSYAWMVSLYTTAITRFDALIKNGNLDAACDLIRELGKEALAENADWVIYHREREPQMKGH